MSYLYFVLTIAIAIFFYWLRVNRRALYGVCEIVIAIVIIYQLTIPDQPTILLWDGPDPANFFLASKIVGFFAGVYAFVRGMDNLVTGLREA
ncbi:MAG: hypothetical protein AB7H90_21250 [Alphaproteobacteria bacterium]